MNKQIVDLLDDLINRKAKVNYGRYYLHCQDISEDEKLQLCSLLMLDDEYHDYLDSFVDIREKISSELLMQDSDTKFDLIDSLHTAIKKFYENRITQMLKDRCAERDDLFYDDKPVNIPLSDNEEHIHRVMRTNS